MSRYEVISQPGELRTYLAGRLNADEVRIIYKPLAGNKIWHFRSVTEIVLEYGKRLHAKGKGVLYFVDEMDYYCPPEGIKTKTKKYVILPEISQAIEYGRHRGVGLGYTTRRAYRVHINLRAQTSTFRIFRTSEPTDLQYFERIMGGHVKKIPTLKQYEYLEWVDDANVDPRVRGGRW